MKRLRQVFGAIALLIVVGLTIDYLRVEAKERRVFHAISQCGGQCGSIPAWPFGTEYRITFRSALSSDELSRLNELNTLRGWVGVAFADCELSDDQVREVTAELHQCKLFRVIDGDMSPLAAKQCRPPMHQETTVFRDRSALNLTK